MACDLGVIGKNERVLKVTGSHVHFKNGSIKTVLDRNMVTTSHDRKEYMAYLKAAIATTLGVYTSRSFIDCNIFQMG